ncbi:hypothetical protein G4B88_020779 [Cannabis sativa]|uniref:Uncharacterized protein n=1 Tax=Cannabis sativa TaxID=3483 RepID=A0A7J6HLL4_CANSA|nr:hypothetical protein G4B88_020779 [Cannabis sativa]
MEEIHLCMLQTTPNKLIIEICLRVESKGTPKRVSHAQRTSQLESTRAFGMWMIGPQSVIEIAELWKVSEFFRNFPFEVVEAQISEK